jgi:ArsR family transcriptional regulator
MTDFLTLQAQAQRHKAMAEPMRLRILCLLSARVSLCVCDVVSVLAQPQSSVSRHLAVLRNAGWVKTWREGNWIHYALTDETQEKAWLVHALAPLKECPEVQRDLAQLMAYEKAPRHCGAIER